MEPLLGKQSFARWPGVTTVQFTDSLKTQLPLQAFRENQRLRFCPVSALTPHTLLDILGPDLIEKSSTVKLILFCLLWWNMLPTGLTGWTQVLKWQIRSSIMSRPQSCTTHVQAFATFACLTVRAPSVSDINKLKYQFGWISGLLTPKNDYLCDILCLLCMILCDEANHRSATGTVLH